MEFTANQRAGIQVLSHAILRMRCYDKPATDLMEGLRKEIRADAVAAEKLNLAYEKPSSAVNLVKAATA